MARYNPRENKGYSRRSGFRKPKQSFLIICEGVNTEPDYFNAFRLTSASVKAVGKGLNTIKLVQEAFIIGWFYKLALSDFGAISCPFCL